MATRLSQTLVQAGHTVPKLFGPSGAPDCWEAWRDDPGVGVGDRIVFDHPFPATPYIVVTPSNTGMGKGDPNPAVVMRSFATSARAASIWRHATPMRWPG